MTKLSRRSFIRDASAAAALAAGAAALPGCARRSANRSATAAGDGQSYRWKMVTAWSPHFPVLGESADKVADWIAEMSGGRLTIQVYGGGEIVPPLEAFDAVSQGIVEMGHAASYYWAGKVPAAQFFAAVPFGLNAQQMNAWLYGGGGLALWETVYAPFNLVPFPVGNSGVQMGGWFNREIRSVADLHGLKMRIPGLGGRVIDKAGGAAILSAGAEIYTNLERGVIDAAEWIGPYHDFLMGFHRIANYYYYPGWHEPGTTLELFVNKSAFDALPVDLQQIIRTAAARSNVWMLSEFEARNSTYLRKLVDEHHVELRKFPRDVLQQLRRYSDDVIADVVAGDPLAKQVYDSFQQFRKSISHWSPISEQAYFEALS